MKQHPSCTMYTAMPESSLSIAIITTLILHHDDTELCFTVMTMILVPILPLGGHFTLHSLQPTRWMVHFTQLTLLPHLITMYMRTSVHIVFVHTCVYCIHTGHWRTSQSLQSVNLNPTSPNCAIQDIAAVHCIVSLQQPMSQWPTLATLYSLNFILATLYSLQFTRATLYSPLSSQIPAHLLLRGSSLLSDFLPVYNLSNALSFETAHQLQPTSHVAGSPTSPISNLHFCPPHRTAASIIPPSLIQHLGHRCDPKG